MSETKNKITMEKNSKIHNSKIQVFSNSFYGFFFILNRSTNGQ